MNRVLGSLVGMPHANVIEFVRYETDARPCGGQGRRRVMLKALIEDAEWQIAEIKREGSD